MQVFGVYKTYPYLTWHDNNYSERSMDLILIMWHTVYSSILIIRQIWDQSDDGLPKVSGKQRIILPGINLQG